MEHVGALGVQKSGTALEEGTISRSVHFAGTGVIPLCRGEGNIPVNFISVIPVIPETDVTILMACCQPG